MKKRILGRTALVTLALLLGLASAAYAGTSALGTTTVQAIVPSSIAATVPGSVVLGVSIDSTITTPMSIPIDSNTTWSMTVVKDADLTSGIHTVPSAQLVYSSTVVHGTGQSADTQFLVTPTAVVTNGTAIGEGGDTVVVTYKIKATDNEAPGTYVAHHTYYITTP
jgi:hypothetical protein